MSRGKRTPTGEELELWEKVTESIAPLERQRVRISHKTKPPPPKPDKKPAQKKAAPTLGAKPPLPKPKPPPALNPFDRRTLSRIGRGTVAIDARIDLHGMTQDAAQARLTRFIADAQTQGAKLVLVITGKGTSGTGERGVLRRVVPMWLASAELRPYVVGFDEAGPAHGGGGALYVRIRRARG
jgi:DNA-nicking Smr family endonuclease